MNESEQRQLVHYALGLIEFGACEGCGRMRCCPICSGTQESGHGDGCPVGDALGGSARPSDDQIFTEQERFGTGL